MRSRTPEIGDGEILIRVEACGVCHTDLKKIEYNLLAPPRIYGHETAGVVAHVGRNVTKFKPGDRVIVFHHIPCGNCFYCARKLYAQCPVYKKVGVTAGFEPAGGGFSQYVRVMDWIVERGVEKIPDGVPFEVAAFVEPVNTCLKAVEQCDPQPDDVVLVQGQGPIGLLFTMLLKLRGCTILATDTIPRRLELAKQCGATFAHGSAHGRCFGEAEGTDRRPRRRHGFCRDQRQRTGGRSGAIHAAGRENHALRADLGQRANRAFRSQHLRGRTVAARLLQRFGRYPEGVRGPGFQREIAGSSADFASRSA